MPDTKTAPPKAEALMETEHIIGNPVQGKPGWFHPGPTDQAWKNHNGTLGMNDGSTHRTTPAEDGTSVLFVKVGGLWKQTTDEEIEAGVK